MHISIIHEDDSENEFEIEMCCGECAATSYGWSSVQFSKVMEMLKTGPIKIPSHISDENKFKEFIKTL